MSHRKAPPTFIDDVLEKFRAHNEQEEQKGRQMSLPVHTNSSFLQMARFPRPTSMNDVCGENRDIYEARHAFASKLVDTQEEEESCEPQSPITDNHNTLSILKQTEEVLKSLSDRMEPQTKVASSVMTTRAGVMCDCKNVVSSFLESFNTSKWDTHQSTRSVGNFSYANSQRGRLQFTTQVGIHVLFYFIFIFLRE